MATIKLENILFLDIETVPVHYKYEQLSETEKNLWNKKMLFAKDKTSEEHYLKAGVYSEFAKVICIGLGFYHENKFRVKCIAGDNEKELLIEFSKLVTQFFNKPEHHFCAHNGKEFDFPFLCRRMVVHRIALPKNMDMQGKKPWEVKHLDTMEMWRFGDYKNFTSLNLLAYVLNIPSPKDDLDGSMVAKAFYEENGLDRIKKYCLKDVITLARVYQSFTGRETIADSDIVYN